MVGSSNLYCLSCPSWRTGEAFSSSGTVFPAVVGVVQERGRLFPVPFVFPAHAGVNRRGIILGLDTSDSPVLECRRSLSLHVAPAFTET